ncbi:MAG: 2OG-Fe(II) oxygenase [Alphaproteobacteria bacterium]|nr:2OG-Fe(II) oxygenase [Alphaproteobacteria bacterium]
MNSRPRIEAVKIDKHAFDLVPSSPTRDWMDVFPDRHPYRCLPLAMANAHGWDVLCPISFDVTWNGGPEVRDLTIEALEPMPGGLTLDHFARSNFSRGILTLHTNYLFRTPPDWNILVSGPFNRPKQNASPLTGIIESDWLPYPFTMNWQIMSPGTVRFEKGEPFCTVMPIPKHYIEDWDMVVHEMSDDPVLAAEQETFRQSRDRFMEKMRAGDAAAVKQGWQRHYFVGRHPDGSRVEGHSNKLRVAEPIAGQGTRPIYAKDQPSSEEAARVLAGQGETPAATEQQAAPSDNSAAVAAPKPWKPTSVLTHIDDAQSALNEEGRKRLHDGILTRSRNTIDVPGPFDPSALDFIYAPDFLSPEECKVLSDTSRDLSSLQLVEGVKDDYWSGRILDYSDILRERPEAARIAVETQKRITQRLEDFYELTAPVYADFVHMIQWREGMFLNPHCDRANPDGAPHGMPWRDFASIVYLNDDYEGGSFYFTALDMLIKPKAGTLVAFTGGFHHEHGVLTITKGTRITLPTFYTFDKTRRDMRVYPAT